MPRAKTQAKKVTAKTVKKTATKVTKSAKKETLKETGLKLSIYSIAGRVLGSFSLPKEIFGVEINNKLMAQAARVYLANQRRGTVKTKSRGEVNISTRKIYRQKGTGRARHGAASAPIFVGGGIAFGPKPRDYSLKLSQKMKRKALFSSLTSKVKDSEVKVIDGLEKIEPKTKKMAEVLKKLQLENGKQILLVTPSFTNTSEDKAIKNLKNIYLSARNIKKVSVRGANLLNTYEVLQSSNILFMKSAIEDMKKLTKI